MERRTISSVSDVSDDVLTGDYSARGDDARVDGGGVCSREDIESEMAKLVQLLETLGIQLQDRDARVRDLTHSMEIIQSRYDDLTDLVATLHRDEQAAVDKLSSRVVTPEELLAVLEPEQETPPESLTLEQQKSKQHRSIRNKLISVARVRHILRTEMDVVHRRHGLADRDAQHLRRQIEEISRENRLLLESNARLIAQVEQQRQQQPHHQPSEGAAADKISDEAENEMQISATTANGRSPSPSPSSGRPKTAASTTAGATTTNRLQLSPSRAALVDRVWRSLSWEPMHHLDDVVRLVVKLKKNFRDRAIDLPLRIGSVKPKDRDCLCYLGSKRIYLNVVGGELVIRAGGGYQNLEEFLQKTRF